MSTDQHHELLLLLSGGIDSMACLHFYAALGRPVKAVHVSYGQPAALREAHAATSIAQYFGVPVSHLRLTEANKKQAGLIRGRNAFLIFAAYMEAGNGVTGIALGVHAGTEYSDCSADFLARVQNVIDILAKRPITMLAPFLEWTKRDIIDYCTLNALPIDTTYSCENGDTPCRACLSCLDREAFNVSSPIEPTTSVSRRDNTSAARSSILKQGI